MDVLASYSKKPSIADDLARVLYKLGQARKDASPAERQSVKSEQPPGAVWRVADRLSEADIQRLVSRYREGATGRELAAEFRIGLTNVKRLLRERGARRKDQ